MASIKTLTHDISSAGFHIPDFTSFLSHLTDAVSAAWPDKFATRYKKVKVLLMSWDKDDLGLEPDIRQLESVFRGLYHYDAEYWKIPSKRTVVEVSRKVADLGDAHGQEGNLLIVYYGGQTRPSDQAGGSVVWAANRTRDSPTIQSSIVHSLLGEVDCDVLLLNDGLDPNTTREPHGGRGVVESLAASGVESASAEEGNHGFTAALVQELAHAAHTTDWLSVVELHRRLINRLQAWTPKVSLNDDAYSLVQVDRRTGQPIFEMPRRRTPIHTVLSDKPRTIVLTPLAPQAGSQLDQAFLQLTLPTVQPQVEPDGPGILVTCRLRDQRVDVGKWKQWLSDAPEGAKGIQISALYPGFSTILIVELPLVVWDLLPPSPAISFIAYTTGNNHISDFRRALLGFDPEEQSDSSDDESNLNDEQKHSNKTSSHKQGKDRHSSASLWPKAFNSDRTAVYAEEREAYCLSLAEMHGDERGTKAERIMRVFVQGDYRPSTSYICDEIQDFCFRASFEALSSAQGAVTNPIAILDERFPKSPLSQRNGARFLGQGELFEALTAIPRPQLIDSNSKSDPMSPRRRLIYLTNLDPAGTLALAATTSEIQALCLRDFVYQHLSFQSGMEATVHSTRGPHFQLSFHLPFLAWRRSKKPSLDARLGGDRHPLRNSKNISFLDRFPSRAQIFIHEVQISVTVAGLDNRHWTAYGFFDTYHDRGESKLDVRSYQTTQGGPLMDPLTCGYHSSEDPVWDAREYFVRAMEACVREVREEWQNTGRQLLKSLKAYAMGNRKPTSRRAEQVSHQSIEILEQLIQRLSGTISAWDTFQETSLAYFNLNDTEITTMLRHVSNDIQSLRTLERTLTQQKDTLKSLTLRLLHIDSNRQITTTNALMTTALAFLPFTLVALLTNTPSPFPHASSSPIPLTHHQFSLARYLVVSAAVAALAAALCFVLMNWAAAVDKAEGLVERLRGMLDSRLANLSVIDDGAAGGRMVKSVGGGSSWQRPAWWSSVGGGGGSKGYRPVREEKLDEDAREVDAPRGLPF
ncbi:hypothetical protein VTI74DRAFT_6676 [Chaetomium olivicolor]